MQSEGEWIQNDNRIYKWVSEVSEALKPRLTHATWAYPGFRNMKRLGVFLLSLDGMLVLRRSLSRNLLGFPNNSPVPIYTPRWRDALRELNVLPNWSQHSVPSQGSNLDRSLRERTHWSLGYRASPEFTRVLIMWCKTNSHLIAKSWEKKWTPSSRLKSCFKEHLHRRLESVKSLTIPVCLSEFVWVMTSLARFAITCLTFIRFIVKIVLSK